MNKNIISVLTENYLSHYFIRNDCQQYNESLKRTIQSMISNLNKYHHDTRGRNIKESCGYTIIICAFIYLARLKCTFENIQTVLKTNNYYSSIEECMNDDEKKSMEAILYKYDKVFNSLDPCQILYVLVWISDKFLEDDAFDINDCLKMSKKILKHKQQCLMEKNVFIQTEMDLLCLLDYNCWISKNELDVFMTDMDTKLIALYDIDKKNQTKKRKRLSKYVLTSHGNMQ